MPHSRAEPGCRDTAIATLFFLGFAVAFMITGWSMTSRPDCRDLCETAGLTLLYAGGPLSALLGVLFGGVWVAWPLDITLWVVAAFWAASLASRRSHRVQGLALVVLATALAYGLVLSLFVEIAPRPP